MLATLGLAGAVYAADKITEPGSDGDIGKVITEQRITEGQVARPPTDEHQREKLNPEQMLELGTKYNQEMKQTLEHAELVRVDAYRSRDIIRMTCVDDKLSQMKTVLRISEPRAGDLHELLGDEIVMQQPSASCGRRTSELPSSPSSSLTAPATTRRPTCTFRRRRSPRRSSRPPWTIPCARRLPARASTARRKPASTGSNRRSPRRRRLV
jgi:hypothetical protein